MFETVTGESLCVRLLTQRFGRGLPSPEDLQNTKISAVLGLLAVNGTPKDTDLAVFGIEYESYLSALNMCYRRVGFIGSSKTPIQCTKASVTFFYP